MLGDPLKRNRVLDDVFHSEILIQSTVPIFGHFRSQRRSTDQAARKAPQVRRPNPHHIIHLERTTATPDDAHDSWHRRTQPAPQPLIAPTDVPQMISSGASRPGSRRPLPRRCAGQTLPAKIAHHLLHPQPEPVRLYFKVYRNSGRTGPSLDCRRLGGFVSSQNAAATGPVVFASSAKSFRVMAATGLHRLVLPRWPLDPG